MQNNKEVPPYEHSIAKPGVSSGVFHHHISVGITSGKDVIAAPAVIKVGGGKNAQEHIIRPGPREIKRRLNFPEIKRSGVFGTAPNRPLNLGNVSDQAGQEAALAVTATTLTGAPATTQRNAGRVDPKKVVAAVGGVGVGLWGLLALL